MTKKNEQTTTVTHGFTASVEARKIYDYLKAQPVGAEVSYETLYAVSGRTMPLHRHLIDTATKALVRDDKIVYGALRGRGVKRLADAEIIGVAGAAIKHIGKKAKRTIKQIVACDYTKLSPNEKITHTAQTTILAMVANQTTPARLAEIEQQSYRPAEMLDVLRGRE